MATIHIFNTPVNVRKTRVLDYYLNIRDGNGNFVKGMRFEGYSEHAFYDELKEFKEFYPKDYQFET